MVCGYLLPGKPPRSSGTQKQREEKSDDSLANLEDRTQTMWRRGGLRSGLCWELILCTEGTQCQEASVWGLHGPAGGKSHTAAAVTEQMLSAERSQDKCPCICTHCEHDQWADDPAISKERMQTFVTEDPGCRGLSSWINWGKFTTSEGGEPSTSTLRLPSSIHYPPLRDKETWDLACYETLPQGTCSSMLSSLSNSTKTHSPEYTSSYTLPASYITT